MDFPIGVESLGIQSRTGAVRCRPVPASPCWRFRWRNRRRRPPNSKNFSFLIASAPRQVRLEVHDARATAEILRNLSAGGFPSLSPLQLILEKELNANNWSDPGDFPSDGVEVFYASVYALSDARAVVVLRFHTSVCDRTTAEELLMELMELVEEKEGGAAKKEIENEGEGEKGIESLIPNGMGKKTLWSHGMDMLGYSLNSFRLTNLKFKNTKSARRSEVVRFQINARCTASILAICKSKGIKLCGALAAAALLAARSTKSQSSDKKKYGVVTLTDCRSILDPPLPAHHFGFYHSAILNIHSVKGTENLWDLAKICYSVFEEYKKCNRHFSDMADLNFLMSKAVDNPSLTASSSLRSALISVFEDPVIDNSKKMQQKIGVEDYIGCASAHGIGPSIGMFDTVRNGELDCACVYPAPLHSRDQITELVDRVKRLLIDGCF
ncbi:uncharacterized protein LOC127263343 isoform X2 [Andrographis paniculata]|uniref:uncharacterized protein LOC127263343 isoform X2 n=1 Tax=Andrographis paniculata TaxID=175694 RepID=UPI0021E7D47D|nr:uncharacterized protein LOC127263343 isoform X2 [Andrographis paniculata]